MISASGFFLAVNRHKYNFIVEIVRASTLLAFLLTLPAIYGVNGVILSLLLANVVVLPVHMFLWCRLLPLKGTELIRIYATLIVLSAVVFASVSFTIAILNRGMTRLLASVIAGLVSYLMGALIIYKYMDVGPARLWYDILLGRRLNKISVQ